MYYSDFFDNTCEMKFHTCPDNINGFCRKYNKKLELDYMTNSYIRHSDCNFNILLNEKN